MIIHGWGVASRPSRCCRSSRQRIALGLQAAIVGETTTTLHTLWGLVFFIPRGLACGFCLQFED